MKVVVDTNLLLRLLVDDDLTQQAIAADELGKASRVFLSTVALCEVVWVLTRTYRFSRAEVGERLRLILDVEKMEYERQDIEAGLGMLDRGGDFADGVIARQGRSRRAEVFVSFDRQAVRRLLDLGQTARLAGT